MRARRTRIHRRRLDEPSRVLHVLSVSTHSRAWTPGRVASISVLALAVGALVVDKAFLGHSEPTSAAADQVAPVAGASGGAGFAPVESLAHRLERHRSQATVAAGKAFVAPAGFFPEAVAAEPSVQQGAAGAQVVQIAWPRLSAVVTGSTPGAILDGRLIRAGESIGGVELIQVSERSVTVRHGEHEAVLTLDETHR